MRQRRTNGQSSLQPAPSFVLLFGALTLGSAFFVRQAPLFSIEDIRGYFGQGEAADALLSAAIGIGWAGGLAVAHVTSGRWPNRWRVIAGLTVAGGGTLFVLVGLQWWVVVVGHGLACLGAGSTTPAVLSAAYGAVPHARRGLAAGTVLSGSRIGGSIIAPLVVIPLTASHGWRLPIVIGLLAIVTVALLAPRAIASHSPLDAPPSRQLVYHPGGRRNLTISAFNCSVLLLWVTAVAQFGGPMLEEWLGSGAGVRGAILGSFGVGASVAAFAVPMWSDRIGRRLGQIATLAVGAAAGLGLSLLAAGESGSVALVLALLLLGGTSMGGLPMALALIPADAIAVGDRGRAMIVPTVTAELLGGGLGPAGLAVLDAEAGPVAPIAVSAGLLVVGIAVSLLLVPMPSPTVDPVGRGPRRREHVAPSPGGDR